MTPRDSSGASGTTSSSPEPLLLAGMRLTGADPHLGTFYGWIRPVAQATTRMRVCVLIADLQSLDVPRTRPIGDETDELQTALREFLPADTPIICESQIPMLSTLAILAAPLFAPHHLRRIAPLRAMCRTGQPIPASTWRYPAMMIADVLAIGATHVLAKPEGRFQHADVLNDVLHRGARRYGWPAGHLSLHPKPKVDIPAGDGSRRPMKRDRLGVLKVNDAARSDITAWTTSLPVPGYSEGGDERAAQCPVAWQIWQTQRAVHPPDSAKAARADAICEGCITNSLSCQECTHALADAITMDLADARTPATIEPVRSSAEASQTAVQQAERNARHLVRLVV